MKELFSMFVNDALTSMGEELPSKNFAMITIGEMTPLSNIQFILLTSQEATEENKKIFTHLNQLLNFKVIHLKEISHFQNVSCVVASPGNSNIPYRVSLVKGDNKLIDAHKKIVDRKNTAFETIKSRLRTFQIQILKGENSFDTFKEIINALALYFDIKNTDLFEQLNGLYKEDVFSKDSIFKLTERLKEIIEEEFSLINKTDRLRSMSSEKPYLMTFFKCLQEFLVKPDKKSFKNNQFDYSLFLQGKEFEKQQQNVSALQVYQKAIKEEQPDHVEAQIALDLIKAKLNMDDSVDGINLYEKKYSENHPSLGGLYHLYGDTYFDKGDYKNALKYYFKALSNNQKNLCDSSIYINIYDKLAICHEKENEMAQAVKYHEHKLKLQIDLYGENYLGLENTYEALKKLHSKQSKKFLEYTLKLISIKLLTCYEHHPDLELIYDECAQVYNQNGDYKNGFQMIQRSYNISLQKFGKNHHEVANKKLGLSRAYKRFGVFREGCLEAKEAFLILINYHQNAHEDVEKALNLFLECYNKHLSNMIEKKLPISEANNWLAEIEPFSTKFYPQKEISKLLNKELDILT
jgi:tetratricopeptide (TPR) repeat protein